jgi:hypothetical protein
LEHETYCMMQKLKKMCIIFSFYQPASLIAILCSQRLIQLILRKLWQCLFSCYLRTEGQTQKHTWWNWGTLLWILSWVQWYMLLQIVEIISMPSLAPNVWRSQKLPGWAVNKYNIYRIIRNKMVAVQMFDLEFCFWW